MDILNLPLEQILKNNSHFDDIDIPQIIDSVRVWIKQFLEDQSLNIYHIDILNQQLDELFVSPKVIQENQK